MRKDEPAFPISGHSYNIYDGRLCNSDLCELLLLL